MSSKNKVFLVEDDPLVIAQLAHTIVRFGYDDYVSIAPNADDAQGLGVIPLQRPIRIGRVLDQIADILKRQHAQTDNIKHIGGHHFDAHLNLFYLNGKDNGIRLTEKEVSLLLILEEAGGEEVSRQVLLDQVWKYVDGVETHTLETHIYRLRQKIERDPAVPKILKTGETGYYLSFE